MDNGFDLSMLQKLTSDPELMSRAISMAQTLAKSDAFKKMMNGSADPSGEVGPGYAGNTGGGFSPQSAQSAHGGTGESCGLGGLGGLSGLGGLFGDAPAPLPESRDGEKSKKGFSSGTHEQRIKLLEAMRPFVPEDRRTKIDFIIKLLGLMQVANQLGLKNILQ